MILLRKTQENVRYSVKNMSIFNTSSAIHNDTIAIYSLRT